MKYTSKLILNGTEYEFGAGGGGGRQPGANTLLYVPMKDDLTDHGPSQFTLTNNGVSLVSNQADIDVGYFDGSSYLSGANDALFNFGDMHLSAWMKALALNNARWLFAGLNNGDIFFGYQGEWGLGRNGVAWDNRSTMTMNTNTRYHISLDRTGTSLTVSLNGTVGYTGTSNVTYVTSGGYRIGNDGGQYFWDGYFSNIIVENKGRTAQEISDYYNQTKSLYGIS